MSKAMKALMPTTAALIDENPAWTFDVLVARVVEFQERNFPDQKVEGVLAHAGDEIKELLANPQDKEEWADLLILFIAALYRSGCMNTDELFAVAHAKMDKNNKRKWGPADARGVYHHTEEGQ